MIRWVRPEKPALGLPEIYGGVGLALLLMARFVPLSRMPFWGCGLRKATGIPCVACGMTRAFDWFMRGRWLDSLIVNPLGFVLALLAAVGVAYLLLRPWRPWRIQFDLSAGEIYWARIAVILVVASNWAYLIVRAWHVKGIAWISH